MEFLKQEYWSELPFPPSGDLPNPGLEPASPALQVICIAGGFFLYLWAPWEAPASHYIYGKLLLVATSSQIRLWS